MPEVLEVKEISNSFNLLFDEKDIFEFVKYGDKCSKKLLKSGLKEKLENKKFSIKCKARGKELHFTFKFIDGSEAYFINRLGMSGAWSYIKPEYIKETKHIGVCFKVNDRYLCFIDLRRFGNFEETSSSNTWGKNRGPCVLTELRSYMENLKNNRHKKTLSDTPIFDVLLNQKYFNGIGNYMRSSILNYMDIDPFKSINEHIKDGKDFSKITREIAYAVFLLSKNRKEMLYYNKGIPVKYKGRTFWSNPKYKDSAEKFLMKHKPKKQK